jgi:hypothetical protein
LALRIPENVVSVSSEAIVVGHRGTAIPPARNSETTSQVAANSSRNATASNTIRWLDQTTVIARAMSTAPLRTRIMNEKDRVRGIYNLQ